MAGSNAAYWARAGLVGLERRRGRRETAVVRLQRRQQDGGASPVP